LQFYGTKGIDRPPSSLEEAPYSGLQVFNQNRHLSREQIQHTTSTKSVIITSEVLSS